MTNVSAALFAGPVVDLDTVLAAREARVARRLEVFATRERPVVSLSPVMPGPVKDCPAGHILRDAALEALLPALERQGWAAEIVHVVDGPAGPEALVSVGADPFALKRVTVALEDSHPLGRLWDLDVIDPRVGAVSRRTLGAEPRRCFVCSEPAHACARSRAHPLGELLAVIEATVDAHRNPPRA
jgi:holo-ACP synthase